MKFYVNSYRELEMELDGRREVIVTTTFLQNENKTKAAEYLRTVAAELTKVFPRNGEKAGEILENAEATVCAAQTAEKFLEPVTF